MKQNIYNTYSTAKNKKIYSHKPVRTTALKIACGGRAPRCAASLYGSRTARNDDSFPSRFWAVRSLSAHSHLLPYTVNGFRLDQTGLMSVCERIALQRSGWPCHRYTIAVCTLCATKVHKVRWHHVPPSVTPPRQDGDVSAENAGRRQPIIAPARRNVSNSRLMSCSERTK